MDKTGTEKKGLLLSVITIVLGILFIAFTSQVQDFICIILGAVCIVFGAVLVIGYLAKNAEKTAFSNDLVVGVIFIVIGALILIFQKRVLTILPIIFGIFLFVSGVYKLQQAVDLKKSGFERWWTVLLMAAVTVILGIVLILKRGAVMSAVIKLIGVFFIIDGAEGVLSAVMMKKAGSDSKGDIIDG